MLRESGLELSFSGLKTAVALEAEKLEARAGGALSASDVDDLCASFQEAALDVLLEKARRALEQTGLERLALVGGLAANTRLRERMAELARELGVETRFPPIALCTDNAAMIGAVADGMLRAGRVAAARPRGVLARAARACGRDIASARRELAAHGLAPSRARGQNFLRRPELATRLVEKLGLRASDAALEIGPGLGQLTRAIAAVARRTLALEVDRGLFALLAAEGSLPASVEVRLADALEADFPALVRELAKPVVLVGNLPYSIAGRLLGDLLVPGHAVPHASAACCSASSPTACWRRRAATATARSASTRGSGSEASGCSSCRARSSRRARRCARRSWR